MIVLKKFFDFYIKSSIHVGLAVCALVYVTAINNNLCLTFFYPCCVFFGTVFGYNLLKYYSILLNKSINFKHHLPLILLSFIAGIGFLFCFFYLDQSKKISIIWIGIPVLGYPFLRKYGLFKIFLVSFCVSIITVYIPFLTRLNFTYDFYITFLQRFLIAISWLIPFEILDSKTDALSLNTIPQKFGINKSKLFGIALVFPFVIIEFVKLRYSFSVIPIGIITVLFIYFSSLNRSKYYTTFWVESIPLFWLGLLFMAQ